MRRTILAPAAVAITLALGVPAVTYGQDQSQVQTQQTRRQARRDRIRQRLRARFQARFERLDANHDGVIGRDEWKRSPRAFDRIDVNHDGALSRDELEAAVVRLVRHRLRR